jgi:hypothetical protein
MAKTQTAEEVRNQCVSAMPAPLGDSYFDLRTQLAWIHLKWNDFRRLYADSEDTIVLLNEAAPSFFHNLQRMMWEDILLHICRITDRPKVTGKDTLTVLRLVESIPDETLKQTIATLVDDVKAKARFARDWRDQRLAHHELPPQAGQTSMALPHASCRNVDDLLEALRKTMNSISLHYLNSSTAWEHSIEAPGGVSAFISCIRRGKVS